MRKLLLIRHSVPVLDEAVPASQWHLSAEGKRLCPALAARLAAHEPAVVVTSTEPKAIETGQMVAAILGLPWETADGLHEHRRPEPGLSSRQAFQAQVARLLRHPDELVMGAETGQEARARFAAAIDRVLARHRAGNVAVVTHGTVLSLFVSQAAGLDPVALWLSLGLPAVVVLSLPGLELVEVVAGVATTG